MLTDRDYMARALFHRRARPRDGRARIRWSARSSCRATASSSGRLPRSARASRMPKCWRSTWPGSARAAARCTARSSRAATWDAPVRASSGSSKRASCASWRPSRIRIRSSAARGSPICREHGVQVEVGPGREAATALNQPFFTLVRKRRPFVILKAAISLDGCIAAAPGRPTRLTSRVREPARAAAPGRGRRHRRRGRHDPRRRSAADARAARYRERPLTRVIFDRRLRTPPGARVLSTPDGRPCHHRDDGGRADQRADVRSALEARGAQLEVAADGTMRAALECLGGRDDQLAAARRRRGGALRRRGRKTSSISCASTSRRTCSGPAACRFSTGAGFRPRSLVERRVEPLGPDVLIEGYVHGPR